MPIRGGGGAPTLGGNSSPLNVVHSNAATITALPNTWYIIDASAGNIVVNLPALVQAQWVGIQQDSGTTFSHTITVTPASGNMDQLVPSNGSFAATFVVGNGTTWTAQGLSFIVFNGGSASGLLLQ